MADATHQYNVSDLNDRLTRYEAALAQIAASLGTYQQLAADLRRDLTAVSQQAPTPIPPPGAVESRAVPPATPPVPSAEAEAARVRSAQSAGIPVNVPPVEGMAAHEAKDQAQDDKDKAAADKATPKPPPEPLHTSGSGTRSSGSVGRSGRSGGDKD